MKKEGLSIRIPCERATFYFDNIEQKNNFIKYHVRYDAKGQPFLINRGWKKHSRNYDNYDYFKE